MVWLTCFAAAEPIVTTNAHGQYSIGRYLSILEDKSGKLEIHNVASPEFSKLFKKSDAENPSYGLTKSAYWIRFDLDTRRTHQHEWLLELSYPVIDEVILFKKQNDGSFKKRVSGDMHAFKTREIKHRNIVFVLPSDTSSIQTYYLRLTTSGSMQIPLTLWDKDIFTAKDHEEQLAFGLYYGIVFVMIVYNIFVFFFIGDKSYLFYSLYLLVFTLFLMAVNGLSFEYLWPQSPWWANKSLTFFAFAFLAMSLLFTREFLATEKLLPKADRFIKIQIWLGVLIAAFSFLISYAILVRMAIVLVFPLVFTILYTAVRSLKKGYRPARYYISAWSVFMGGLVIFVFKTLGILPNNMFTQYGVQIGSTLEVLLLAVALADRISILKKEKEKAEKEAVNAEIYRLKNVEIAQALEKVQILNEQLTESKTHLTEANQYLTELNDEKNEFLGIAAHDLKNPLASIILSTELITHYYDKFSKEAVIDKVKTIEMTAARMRDIVTNLLDVNAIESGKIHMSPENINLTEFVQKICFDYTERAQAKNIELQFQPQVGDIAIFADKQAVGEILDNLVSNALKYSPCGKSVFVKVLKKNVQTALIEVRDEGPGLNEEDQKKLFKKFARLSPTPTGGETSTGLGLSIVKKLCEAIGAQVWCESREGAGAAFFVEIPLAYAQSTPAQTSQTGAF
ncbi:MAG TPA: sensor histidine kinase [Patescibacteria group bacterium]|nr:sensor histidine kinase [Patescibacteria group bacterium]